MRRRKRRKDSSLFSVVPRGAQSKLSWTTTNAGIDHITGFASGTYQVKSPDGAVLEKGKYLCVWSKEKDGKWKAIHDMWNTDSK